MATIIQVRRDTSANWTTVNPILAEGEQGYDMDVGMFKIGDGVSDWNTLAFSGSPIYTEDDPADSNPSGYMNMAVRADTLAAVTDTDGDNIALRSTNKGELYVKQVDVVDVNVTGGSITVGTVEITNDAGNPIPVSATDLDIRNLVFATDKVDISGSTLSANSGVDIGDVTINNAAGASAVNIQDGGNSVTVDAPVGTPVNVQIGDATRTATVRDTGASDSLNVAITDASGNQITTFGGASEYTEGATDASITGTAILMEGAADTLLPVQGTVADGLLVNLGGNNDVTVTGTVAVTQSGTWDEVGINDSGNSITVDDGGSSLTVDGTVSISGAVDTELPSAAALADDTANPTTTSVGVFPHWYDGTTWDRAKGDSTDGLLVNLGANNDISGTVTANAGTNLNTSALALETTATSIKTAVEIIDNAISGNEMQVDVVAALPAGTNYVGKVRLTDGTLDSNLVDETGASAVDALAVGGGTPHDSVDSGNPIKVGFKAASALPTAVASADRANGISDLFGRQLVSHIDPAMQIHKSFNATTQQTGSDVWTPTAGKKIVVTSVIVGTYGTTSGRLILWFGANADTTYSEGTDQVLLKASFAPSTTTQPGLVYCPPVPIFANTADHEIHCTTDAAMSLDITLVGYEI